MLVRLDDPTLADDLCAHFRRAGFTVDRSGDSMISVEKPDAPNGTQAKIEIQGFLEIWRVMNPGQGVDLIP